MFLGEHDYWDKRWSYEESLRSPFLVRYPREIAPQSVADDLMANIDVAPTLVDYAGAEIPGDMQGFSCRAMLAGDPKAPRREAVYFRYWMHLAHGLHVPAHYGIRTDRWKLIFYYGLPLDATGAQEEKTPAGWELYDMAADPFELHNLYGAPDCTEIASELRQELDEVKQQYGDMDEQYPDLRERRRTTQ
jgi:arylsulfatase A-like enzyme